MRLVARSLIAIGNNKKGLGQHGEPDYTTEHTVRNKPQWLI